MSCAGAAPRRRTLGQRGNGGGRSVGMAELRDMAPCLPQAADFVDAACAAARSRRSRARLEDDMTAQGRIGIYSQGLWRLRERVAALTALTPVRRWVSPLGLKALAGWGHKPTAARARGLAQLTGLPYLAIEDGFFRSVAPGDAELSISHVCDAEGIYYDASGPSALERLTRARAADPAAAARAAAPALEAIKVRRLSKYNLFALNRSALIPLDRAQGGAVLVVDQTQGDAAVTGAGAARDSFRAMLIAATVENPDALIVLKTHPETHAGRRRGYLDAGLIADAARRNPAVDDARRAGRLITLTASVAPMDALDRVAKVYAVSSLLGLEALIAGRPVVSFGQSFYSGWGLTDDRAPATGRRTHAPLECLVAAAFADYARYFDPETGAPCGLDRAIDGLADRKARWLSWNPPF